MGLEDSLFQIVVAEEKEIEYKNGKPVEKNTQSILWLFISTNDHDR